jgi:hypothetical protein
MTYGLVALSASVFAGLDLLRADGPFLRVPGYRVTVAGSRLRVYLGAHNSSFKPNPLRGSA